MIKINTNPTLNYSHPVVKEQVQSSLIKQSRTNLGGVETNIEVNNQRKNIIEVGNINMNEYVTYLVNMNEAFSSLHMTTKYIELRNPRRFASYIVLSPYKSVEK